MEGKRLRPVSDLFRESFKIYFKKENLIFLTKFALVFALVLLIPALFISLLVMFVKGFNPLTIFQVMPVAAAFLVVLVVALAILAVWTRAAKIKAVSLATVARPEKVETVFADVWPKLLKYFLASLLAGFLVALGLIFFVVPGVILAIWFAFVGIMVIIENADVITALKKSRELVRGYFWQVLGRLFIFGVFTILTQIVASFIPFVGMIALILFAPYYALLPYLLYQDLKSAKT